jgi:hypothetical protein
MASNTAAFPSVVAAVVTVAEGAVLPDVRVVRGRDLTNEASDVVMVGLADVENTGWGSAGAFQQTMQTFGGNREEIGTVACQVVAWNGDADQDAACSTAFAHLAALEAAVRAAPALGLTVFDYVVAEFQAGEVMEAQTDLGASTAIGFTITYKIRI